MNQFYTCKIECLLQLLQLDGEVIQKYEKLQVELLKGALKFITAKDNRYYKN